jgi:hypothetical protein
MRPLSSVSKHLPVCTELYIDAVLRILIRIDLASVADPDPNPDPPDPRVFGPLGSRSGSNSQRFGSGSCSGSGSGSFYPHAKIVR